MQGMWKRRGNLWAPFYQAASSIAPVSDVFAAYITYSELYGAPISLDDVVARVKCVPKRQWLAFTGLTSMVIDGVGTKPTGGRDGQKQLASVLLKGEVRNSILQRMEHNGWVWAAPRPLVGLAKLSLTYAPEESASNVADPFEFMVLTLLALNDHLDTDLDLSDADGRWSTITRFAVRNLPYMTTQWAETMVRIWNIFELIPRQEPDVVRPEYPDLGALFFQETGVPLNAFMAIVFGILSSYTQIDWASREATARWLIDPEWFNGTAIPRQSVEKLLERITLRDQDVRKLTSEDYRDPDYFYRYSGLTERPFMMFQPSPNLRVGPAYFPFFRWRVTEAIYWECFTRAQSTGQLEAFFQAIGAYFQRYVERLFQRAVPSGHGLEQRLWCEPKFNPGDPAVDIIVRYPEAYVFVEVTGSQFQYVESQLNGTEESITTDLQKILYDEVEQLDKAIHYFLNGHLKLNGARWNGERIYPLLISYGSLPTFEPIWSTIEQDIASRGLLIDDHIAPLTAIDPAEVPLLTNLAKRGIRMDRILAEKTAAYRGTSFRNFVIAQHPDYVNPSEVWRPEFEDLKQHVQAVLFPNLGDPGENLREEQ